ncbi:MAG: hypothetical protein ACXVAT_20230 [Isosphaeraceae bacterium]
MSGSGLKNFERAVRVIRERGYKAKYNGHWYTQLDLDGYFYWTMGWSVEATILINRKPLSAKGAEPAA